MIVINANGFRCQHEEKIGQMKEFFMSNQIDTTMLRETNGKSTTGTIDALSSKMKALGREKGAVVQIAKIIKTKFDWLQGVLMNMITGKTSSLIQHQQAKIDKLGRQMA